MNERRFTGPINMDGHSITSSTPSTYAEDPTGNIKGGEQYINSATGKLRVYNGVEQLWEDSNNVPANIHYFSTKGGFPTVGLKGNFYIEEEQGNVYTWLTDKYISSSFEDTREIPLPSWNTPTYVYKDKDALTPEDQHYQLATASSNPQRNINGSTIVVLREGQIVTKLNTETGEKVVFDFDTIGAIHSIIQTKTYIYYLSPLKGKLYKDRIDNANISLVEELDYPAYQGTWDWIGGVAVEDDIYLYSRSDRLLTRIQPNSVATLSFSGLENVNQPIMELTTLSSTQVVISTVGATQILDLTTMRKGPVFGQSKGILVAPLTNPAAENYNNKHIWITGASQGSQIRWSIASQAETETDQDTVETISGSICTSHMAHIPKFYRFGKNIVWLFGSSVNIYDLDLEVSYQLDIRDDITEESFQTTLFDMANNQFHIPTTGGLISMSTIGIDVQPRVKTNVGVIATSDRAAANLGVDYFSAYGDGAGHMRYLRSIGTNPIQPRIGAGTNLTAYEDGWLHITGSGRVVLVNSMNEVMYDKPLDGTMAVTGELIRDTHRPRYFVIARNTHTVTIVDASTGNSHTLSFNDNDRLSALDPSNTVSRVDVSAFHDGKLYGRLHGVGVQWIFIYDLMSQTSIILTALSGGDIMVNEWGVFTVTENNTLVRIATESYNAPRELITPIQPFINPFIHGAFIYSFDPEANNYMVYDLVSQREVHVPNHTGVPIGYFHTHRENISPEGEILFRHGNHSMYSFVKLSGTHPQELRRGIPDLNLPVNNPTYNFTTDTIGYIQGELLITTTGHLR